MKETIASMLNDPTFAQDPIFQRIRDHTIDTAQESLEQTNRTLIDEQSKVQS